MGSIQPQSSKTLKNILLKENEGDKETSKLLLRVTVLVRNKVIEKFREKCIKICNIVHDSLKFALY